MDFIELFIVLLPVVAGICLICLRIKSSRKNLGMLGTVGTLITKNPDYVSANNVSIVQNSTIGGDSTRQLPDIPSYSVNSSIFYASVDHEREANSPPKYDSNQPGSDTDEDEGFNATPVEHPYAKVKREHPYATVNTECRNDNIIVDQTLSNATQMPPNIQPNFDLAPVVSSQSSGDSVDSSRGYTSISVRRPICHLIGAAAATTAYATVSETSDDMYAAIDDQLFRGTVAPNTTDNYAVIDDSQLYSKIDVSKKTKSKLKSDTALENIYAKVMKNLNNDKNVSNNMEHGGYEVVLQSNIDPGYETLVNATRSLQDTAVYETIPALSIVDAGAAQFNRSFEWC